MGGKSSTSSSTAQTTTTTVNNTSQQLRGADGSGSPTIAVAGGNRNVQVRVTQTAQGAFQTVEDAIAAAAAVSLAALERNERLAVTALEQANDSARQSSQVLTDFAAGVAADARSPEKQIITVVVIGAAVMVAAATFGGRR